MTVVASARWGVSCLTRRMAEPVKSRDRSVGRLAINFQALPRRALPREHLRSRESTAGQFLPDIGWLDKDNIAGVLNRFPTTMVTGLFGGLIGGGSLRAQAR